jgi:hypothetical protein
MTTFWLLEIQTAIYTYKHDNNIDGFPRKNDFQKVLLHSPTLMYGRMWSLYYSKDLLFSPEAREYWRLPDLRPFQSFTNVLPSRLDNTDLTGKLNSKVRMLVIWIEADL